VGTGVDCTMVETDVAVVLVRTVVVVDVVWVLTETMVVDCVEIAVMVWRSCQLDTIPMG
jgi:hypothetical protein